MTVGYFIIAAIIGLPLGLLCAAVMDLVLRWLR